MSTEEKKGPNPPPRRPPDITLVGVALIDPRTGLPVEDPEELAQPLKGAVSPNLALQPGFSILGAVHTHGPGCSHDHGHANVSSQSIEKNDVSDPALRDTLRPEGGSPNHAAHDHAGHSHAAHDHAAHDHAGHSHAAHDHAAHDHAGHSHAAHDHAAHDHAGHSHGAHSHAHEAPTERPETQHAAETGGPAVQVDLQFWLPAETDEAGRFAELERMARRRPGILDLHIRRDGAFPQICAHYDPELLSAEEALKELRFQAGKAAKRFRNRVWMVRDMDSPDCAGVIEHVLRRTPGILSASVAYSSERLVVEYDAELLSERELVKKVGVVGYRLEDARAGHACSDHGHACGLAPANGMRLVGISGVLLAAGLGLSFVPELPTLVPQLFYAGALATAGWYPARSAFHALRAGRVDIETLMVLAAVGAGFLGAFFEGAFLIFLFSLGHALEHRAMERARQAVESLAKLRPSTAFVRDGTQVKEVPVAGLRRGDRILVRPGDRVPLDGVVREGNSNLDQAAITGESVPVPKSAGDGVYAGTVNVDGALEVEVTRLGGETTLARLVDLVAEAEASKSPAQRMTAQVERIFVPLVLVGAPLLVAGLFFTGTPLQESFLRGLSLLVAASPCALAISTPAAVLSAVARAASGGVLIKGGAHLDALGSASAIAFDKTGTLTIGRPKLISIRTLEGSESGLLVLAASAEALSAHPLARAVTEAAAERQLGLLPAAGLVAIHGKGIRAKVAGNDVAIGSEAMFDSLPVVVRQVVEEAQGLGQTTMIVQSAGRFLGVLGVADSLRPEAKEALAGLARLGVERTILLSGDHERVATAVGKELGISEVRAPLMPEEKVRAMRIFSRGGGVAMVGDGVNDAPALAAASVGVSLGGAGSDVALETADVVLMGDDLRRLPFAVGLARAARRVVYQNITIAMGVSGILIVASVMGWVEIAHAVVLHEGSTLLVVFNGLRLLRWKQ